MDLAVPAKVALTLEQRLAALRRLPVDESLSLGLDIGIASCGWAVARLGAEPGIVMMGSRCFEAPENRSATGKLTSASATRREKRGQRRVVRRRRQRIRDVRRLLHEAGLLVSPQPLSTGETADVAPDPWMWRGEGLTRKLKPHEFAAVLIHIARHRGFWSNSKRAVGDNAADDTKKMLKAIEGLEEKVAQYSTFGEMLVSDPDLSSRKRNREGIYDRTPKRDTLANEVRKLFAAQRRFGNAAAISANAHYEAWRCDRCGRSWPAADNLEERYVSIAFHQCPLRDSESLVGPCTFVSGERRAARNGYSFELFRYLGRLTTLTLVEGPGRFRRLTREEIVDAKGNFGTQKSITFKTLRQRLGLPDSVSFEGVPRENAEGKKASPSNQTGPSKRRTKRVARDESSDVVASLGAAYGTYRVREAIGDSLFRSLLTTPEKLDRIAEVISFRDDFTRIALGLDDIGLDAPVRAALTAAVERGDFKEFRQSGHVSALAARNMIPHFLAGAPTYDEAAKAAGYNHTTRRTEPIEKIGSPTVRRSLGEAVKQVLAVLAKLEHRPGRIHVELARDVGRSIEMRDKIALGIKRRTDERNDARGELERLFGRSCSIGELLRFELWREQQGRCIYTDSYIDPDWLRDGQNEVQIDHALPRSRGGESIRINQVLCLTSANQIKRNATAREWFGKSDSVRWARFSACVERLPIKGMKKRNLLMRNFADRETKFLERNLTDTRYAAKALLGALEALYGGRHDENGNDRLFARPGQITWNMRKAWGVEDLKKSPDGERQGDRHHALDALVCACTTESELHAVTREMQRMEAEGRSREVVAVPPPWPSFRQDAAAALARVFVSRSEIRRARGEGHGATIYSVSERDGDRVIYERKAVDKLTEKDLDRIKDPERNAATVAALRDWLARGKKGEPPRSPRGDVIRKIRIATDRKPALSIRGGLAARTELVRVDVFRKGKKYHLVPVYLSQIVDRAGQPKPPDRAVIAYKDENEWTQVDASFDFAFALHPYSYVELVTSKGEVFEGYYRGLNRATGAFTISPMADKSSLQQGIGGKTLLSFRKFQIDRLGRRSEIPRETRTWRGAVCT